ncbi:hypothetical protein KC725_05535 [Candidatus Peregrinibacteria bacterium]|nr:hypothetical protein [Candidatus Peregrinibacteria bacterium]
MTTRIPEGHGGVETKSHLQLVYSAQPEQTTTDDIRADVSEDIDATVEEKLTAFDRLIQADSEEAKDVVHYIQRLEELGIDTTLVRNMFIHRCSAHKVFVQFRTMVQAILHFYENSASRENGVHFGLFREEEQHFVPFRREAERVADMIDGDPNLYREMRAVDEELDTSVKISREVPMHEIFRRKS